MFVCVKTLPHIPNDEQLDTALYAWFIQQKATGEPISGESKTFLRAVKRGANSQLNFVFFILYFYIIVSLILIFSIIRTKRVRVIEVRL